MAPPPPSVWWWKRRARASEPVDQVALRLTTVADELEEATGELRAIVSGLRTTAGTPAGAVPTGTSSEGKGFK